MPEMRVAISDDSGHILDIQPDGSILTTTIPVGGIPYTSLVNAAAGVVAANNFQSIFNPIGSGKIITITRVVVYPYAGGAATATGNMEVWRISAASAGTLLAAANINKYDTTQPNSIAEVRTGNPTVTLVGTLPVLAVPPALTSAGAGVSAATSIVPPTGSLFILRPGEGVVSRTPSGDVDQVWSFGFSWLEM